MRDIVMGMGAAEQSAGVLGRAMQEAESAHRPLRMMHAWSTPTWVGGPTGVGYASLPPQQDSSRWAKDAADELLATVRLGQASGTPVSTEVAQGDAGVVLVREAQEAGLVVVGRRSHGAVLSAVLGSATGYVLHHAPCPVMVVPETAATGRFRRIVVGFDDTECSHSALRWALDAARRNGCPVVVLHALRITAYPAEMSVALLYPDYEGDLQRWLDGEVSAIGHAPDIELTTGVREGSADDVLLAEAGPEDLLVLGSRGRGGFTGLLLGSVATRCAQHARGAVVVVRAGAERLDDQATSRPAEAVASR